MFLTKNSVDRFRFVSFMEGISYVVLLFIAMPIKYIGQEPILVKYIGMLHGILFLLFVFFFVQFAEKHFKNIWDLVKIFLFSLLPFGFLYIEKKLKHIKNTEKEAVQVKSKNSEDKH